MVVAPIQQRQRNAAYIGGTQRTPDTGMKHAEDVSERWRTPSSVSRMRYSHPLLCLEPPDTWIGAFAFLGHYPFVQQRLQKAFSLIRRPNPLHHPWAV